MSIAIAIAMIGKAWCSPYAGVDLYKVEGLKGIAYQSAATGMTGITPYGIVRTYIGASEEEAIAWVDNMLVRYERFQPEPYELPDESYATDGVLYIVRRGNIGLLSYGKAQSFKWLQALEKALVPGEYIPPAPPVLIEEKGRWRVEAPNAAHVSYVGGRRDPMSHSLVFLEPPDTVVVWDGLGRNLRWSALSQQEESEVPGKTHVEPPLLPQ
jgi:hypothetical protein